MREEVVLFGQNRNLVGIVTGEERGEGTGTMPAVVILNTGIIHRVGPNRIHVNAARKLAAQGFAVLRFDHSGIGDSGARLDALPFAESAVDEAREAMDFLAEKLGSERFVLIGICSGGSTAFRTACRDNRVDGLVMINSLLEREENIPEGMAEYIIDRKAARSYLRFKVFDVHSWRKFLRGRANYRGIVRAALARAGDLLGSPVEEQPGTVEVESQVRSLLERGVSLLMVYSQGTGVSEYFRITLGRVVKRLKKYGELRVETFPQTDHTFTLLSQQERLLATVCAWAPSLERKRRNMPEGTTP